MLSNVFLATVVMLVCCGSLASSQKGKGPPNEHRKSMILDWFNRKYLKLKLDAETRKLLDKVQSILKGEIPWKGGPGIRRECRTLPDDQRRKLFQCFERLANSGKMAAFEAVHRSVVAPNAHVGPCFIPWHHLFLNIVEIALQVFCDDPTIFLCYWDVTLDELLPNPCESAIFTSTYFGNENGPVTTGPYANKQCLADCVIPESPRSPALFRQCGLFPLSTEEDAESIVNAPNFTVLAWENADEFSQVEGIHGTNHMFVGGQMSYITCSPCDFIFFLYHCYVDMLVQMNLKRRNANIDAEYPQDPNIPPAHRANSPIQPFTWRRCAEELRPRPEDSTYAPRVDRCINHDDCKSKALWCNERKCTAAVRGGADMELGWPGRACFIENCNNPVNADGVCDCGDVSPAP